LLLGMRRDDDLVRLELVDRVSQRGDRVALDDDSGRMHALAVEQVERLVEAAPGGRAAGVVVDNVTLPRAGYPRDRRHLAVAPRRIGGDEVCQRLRRGRLVRGPSDRLHAGAWAVSCVRAGARIACCALGTPYSYGDPTTCGIWVKLKVGGGELTCHSSVSA